MEALPSMPLSSLLPVCKLSQYKRGIANHLEGPVFTKAIPVEGGFKVTIPETPAGTAPLNGQSYVVLTGCDKVVSDDTVAAGPAIIEVRILLFIIH
jgi:hypothetical protein